MKCVSRILCLALIFAFSAGCGDSAKPTLGDAKKIDQGSIKQHEGDGKFSTAPPPPPPPPLPGKQ